MRTKPVPTPPPNDATLPFLKYPITPPITITSPYGIVKQKSCIFPGFLGFQDQDFAGCVTDQAKNGRRKKRIFCKSTAFGRPEMNIFVSESGLGTSKGGLQNVVVLLCCYGKGSVAPTVGSYS